MHGNEVQIRQIKLDSHSWANLFVYCSSYLMLEENMTQGHAQKGAAYWFALMVNSEPADVISRLHVLWLL